MQNSSMLETTKNPKFEFFKRLRFECYTNNVTNSEVLPGQEYNESGLWCPRTFDGFLCWDDTPASSVTVQSCPAFIIAFDPRLPVYKRCTENGTWMHHPDNPRKPWTNYTSCVDVADLNFRTDVTSIYIIGYSISLAALIISLAIFTYFRSLQCARIRIHMHMFTSFALNNIFWIIWYNIVITDPAVVYKNEEWCQVLHVITHYFMVTSYFWMFCEGLHLHIALVVVFVKEDVAMRWFMFVGWVLPFFIILVYAFVRYTYGITRQCWMEESDTFWIITIPVALSLFASFIFLINVVRVLLNKLYPGPNHHASLAMKKAARAALILIPLFGLHFVLIPLRPATGSPLEKPYQYASALLTSLQGLCVAILFCFTNHDVTTAARLQIARALHRTDGFPMTGVTGAESMNNTRDNIV